MYTRASGVDVRWWPILAVVAFLAGCGPAEPEPVRDPAAPRIYRVLNGDTLATIASKRSTTPEKLRAWNELPDGDPAPGTILLIYPPGTTLPTAPAGTAARPLVINDPDPVAPPVERPPLAAAPGILGGETPDLPIPTGVASTPRAAPPGTTALPRSNPGAGAVADMTSPEIERPKPAPAPATASWRVGSPGSLAAPAPKPCLAGPTDAPEGGIALATGLSKAQIKAGMRAVAAAADGCLVGDGSGTFQVTLEVVAACDGRVRSVMVADGGGLPAGVADCVATVARNASFAAHDDQAGTVFLIPVRFER